MLIFKGGCSGNNVVAFCVHFARLKFMPFAFSVFQNHSPLPLWHTTDDIMWLTISIVLYGALLIILIII